MSKKGRGLAASALSLTLIHRSAWKEEFSELRHDGVLGSSAILAAFATIAATVPEGARGKEEVLRFFGMPVRK